MSHKNNDIAYFVDGEGSFDRKDISKKDPPNVLAQDQ